MRDVRLLDQPFSAHTLLGEFSVASAGFGGLCSFIGTVRSDGGRVQALELSHYPPLTLRGMEELAASSAHRFGLTGVLLIHRIGVMVAGDAIVCVAATAAHRRAAFDAVDYMMDHLKAASWFWKRERRADGWHWIEPRPDDRAALARWASGHPRA